VFNGPFHSSDIDNTSFPSLNAVFHAFTITYIAYGVGSNPNPNPGGILLVIVLGISALINWAFRLQLYCDKLKDIFAGIVVGVGSGVAWYHLINLMNPTWVYYGKEEQKGKCVLGAQKFRCSYD